MYNHDPIMKLLLKKSKEYDNDRVDGLLDYAA